MRKPRAGVNALELLSPSFPGFARDPSTLRHKHVTHAFFIGGMALRHVQHALPLDSYMQVKNSKPGKPPLLLCSAGRHRRAVLSCSVTFEKRWIKDCLCCCLHLDSFCCRVGSNYWTHSIYSEETGSGLVLFEYILARNKTVQSLFCNGDSPNLLGASMCLLEHISSSRLSPGFC